MGVKERGREKVKYCDKANIPVNCYFVSPENSSSAKWEWWASNYMPRKGEVSEDVYHLVSDKLEDILKYVNKYVTPLYLKALYNISTYGENIYWG